MGVHMFDVRFWPVRARTRCVRWREGVTSWERAEQSKDGVKTWAPVVRPYLAADPR